MADSFHLRKLAEGAREWNTWRAAHPTVTPDLRYMTLPQTRRQFGPVSGGPVNLRSALLFKADLRNASLVEADLTEAELIEADLRHARLDHADLSGAKLMDASLDHADLSRTILTGVDLTGASLAGARNLTQAQIEPAFGDHTTQLPLNLRMPEHWLHGDARPVIEPDEDLLSADRTLPGTPRREPADLYSVLGVRRSDSAETIHGVYRGKAKSLHPDLNPGNPAAAAAFRSLTHAYAILRDPERRAKYDRGEIGPDGEDREDYFEEQNRKHARHRARGWVLGGFATLAAAAVTLLWITGGNLPRFDTPENVETPRASAPSKDKKTTPSLLAREEEAKKSQERIGSSAGLPALIPARTPAPGEIEPVRAPAAEETALPGTPTVLEEASATARHGAEQALIAKPEVNVPLVRPQEIRTGPKYGPLSPGLEVAPAPAVKRRPAAATEKVMNIQSGAKQSSRDKCGTGGSAEKASGNCPAAAKNGGVSKRTAEQASFPSSRQAESYEVAPVPPMMPPADTHQPARKPPNSASEILSGGF